jgi:SagB-type dehydrogenase family enzyme
MYMPLIQLARSRWQEFFGAVSKAVGNVRPIARRNAPAQPGRRTVVAAAGLGITAGLVPRSTRAQAASSISLMPPTPGEVCSLQAALAQRRSVRSYATQALTLAAVSELLWAAQGVSSDRGLRTAPSAGALYPLELYVVARHVDGLASGVYRYSPAVHALRRTLQHPGEPELSRAAGGQTAIASAPLVLAITAMPARTAAKYGARASRYVAFEAGAASQNVALKAAALGLGTVVVGAFDDDGVAQALGLSAGVRPLALMPVGRPG